MTQSFLMDSTGPHPNRGFTYGLLIAFVFGALCFMPFFLLFNWQLEFAHDNFFGTDLSIQVAAIQETIMQVITELVLLTTVLALILGPLGLWLIRKQECRI